MPQESSNRCRREARPSLLASQQPAKVLQAWPRDAQNPARCRPEPAEKIHVEMIRRRRGENLP